MRAFSYAEPKTSAEALEILQKANGEGMILAGGTDLLSLMKDSIINPKVLVDLKNIPDFSRIVDKDGQLNIGSTTTLSDLLENTTVKERYPSLVQAIEGISSPQIRNMGTIGGDLCQRPRCWYFRRGFGLLATQNGRSMVVEGENRYHAILGNSGPAKFVNASSLAPALIALNAIVEITGPAGLRTLPLADFFRIPQNDGEKENILENNELLVAVKIPESVGVNATYEVRQKEALDWPLTTASVNLSIEGKTVRSALVVLGHVAPMPWVAINAAKVLKGKKLSPEIVTEAGEAATIGSKALSRNRYKIQLVKVAVRRAIRRASRIGGV